MWALRSTEPPRPSLLPLRPQDAASPAHLASALPASPPQHVPSPRLASPAASPPLPPPSATLEAELSRLVQLTDTGSLLAERVALRSRVRELEATAATASTRLAQTEAHSATLAGHLEQGQATQEALAGALSASQRQAQAARAAAAALEGDLSASRARGEDAERRAWQLQALMASQATAAAGVITDWVGGADRTRAARLAFYTEQMEEARARAEGAEAALATSSERWEARLANETLALRLQAEAAEASASGRLAVLGLQLRGEQERSEELAAHLARVEAALREALRRAATAQGDAAVLSERVLVLEAEVARLLGLTAAMHTEDKLQASLAALTAELKAASDAELARVREGYEARMAEAVAREEAVLARVAALEAAAAAAPPPAALQLVVAPAAVEAPSTYQEPVAHASIHNPLLPKGFRSIKAFLDHVRSPSIGMLSSQLVVFVDCTLSNNNKSKNPNKSYVTKSGEFRSLHDVSDPYDPNPYFRVIRVLGKHLEEFDDDKEIPLYGFGDKFTKDKGVFAYSKYEDIAKAYAQGKAGDAALAALLASDADSSSGIEGVLKLYCEVQPRVGLQGPTSFAPAIDKTIEIVEKTGEFTICLIIADGFIDTPKALEASKAAVLRASKYPISIITVGVGDGEPGKPESERWAQMNLFDDSEELEAREFDNFHFVEHNLVRVVARDAKIPEDECFALMALAEIPEQYEEVVKLGILKK